MEQVPALICKLQMSLILAKLGSFAALNPKIKNLTRSSSTYQMIKRQVQLIEHMHNSTETFSRTKIGHVLSELN